jgi:shikimate dehydrogenase
MQVPEGALEDVLRGLQPISNIRGLLVTMPHKNAMFHSYGTSSATARLLKVVSVARRNRDGSWHGDMLDGLSFVAALKKNGAKPNAARVLQSVLAAQAAQLRSLY